MQAHKRCIQLACENNVVGLRIVCPLLHRCPAACCEANVDATMVRAGRSQALSSVLIESEIVRACEFV